MGFLDAIPPVATGEEKKKSVHRRFANPVDSFHNRSAIHPRAGCLARHKLQAVIGGTRLAAALATCLCTATACSGEPVGGGRAVWAAVHLRLYEAAGSHAAHMCISACRFLLFPLRFMESNPGTPLGHGSVPGLLEALPRFPGKTY